MTSSATSIVYRHNEILKSDHIHAPITVCVITSTQYKTSYNNAVTFPILAICNAFVYSL